MNIIIRKIEKKDNRAIKYTIRTSLTEYGGNREGTAYYDNDTVHMFEAYQGAGSAYYVAEVDGVVAGGSGIKQVQGEALGICELQKLYLNKKYRGLGIGKELTKKCIEVAKDFGYKKCYLETFSNMNEALSLYKKIGFKKLNAPVGKTGHDACDVQMIINL